MTGAAALPPARRQAADPRDSVTVAVHARPRAHPSCRTGPRAGPAVARRPGGRPARRCGGRYRRVLAGLTGTVRRASAVAVPRPCPRRSCSSTVHLAPQSCRRRRSHAGSMIAGATTPGGAAGPATALPSLVDALVGAPLDTLDVGALQEQIAAVTPPVFRLQGWLQTAAGRPEQRTGGTLPADDTSRKRSVAGWLADVQHGTPGASGRNCAPHACCAACLLWSPPCSTAADAGTGSRPDPPRREDRRAGAGRVAAGADCRRGRDGPSAPGRGAPDARGLPRRLGAAAEALLTALARELDKTHRRQPPVCARAWTRH